MADYLGQKLAPTVGDAEQNMNSQAYSQQMIDITGWPKIKNYLRKIQSFRRTSNTKKRSKKSIRKIRTLHVCRATRIQQSHMLRSGVLINKFPAFQFGNHRRHKEIGFWPDYRLDFLMRSQFQGQRVLDIGCGQGNLTLQIALKYRPLSIIGVDLSAPLLRYAQKAKKLASLLVNQGKPVFGQVIQKQGPFPSNLNYLVSNFFLMDVESNSLDIVVCLQMPSYIYRTFGQEVLDKLLLTVKRILKTEGIFIVSCKFLSYLDEARFRDGLDQRAPLQVRNPTAQLQNKLVQLGFRVHELDKDLKQNKDTFHCMKEIISFF